MSGSLDLKRKRPMEEGNNLTTVEDIFNQGKAVSTDHYRAILCLVRDEQIATAKKHSSEVDCNSLGDQIALLDEMLDIEYLFDLNAEKDRLGLKLLRAKLDLQAIKVTFIDWDNNGEKWFWSELLKEI
ncbi:hypothetical protein Bca4012_063305 [Brassica carinata]